MEHRVSGAVGRIAGLALAPITGATSAVRRARMFHPSGVVLSADVRSCSGDAPWGILAERLEGPALVRLSGAWWKTREWPDVLGCAIRFARTTPLGTEPTASDQDLLFATIRRPWTMAFAPFTTDQHDYFANRYYAVSPFRTVDAGVIEWRLRPERRIGGPGPRESRLLRALAIGKARFTLEARPYRRVIDVRGEHPFHPVARIELRDVIDIDQDALRFDPFRAGRGVEPIGLIHGLRLAAYRASQWVRPRGTRSHARAPRADRRPRTAVGRVHGSEPTRARWRRRREP